LALKTDGPSLGQAGFASRCQHRGALVPHGPFFGVVGGAAFASVSTGTGLKAGDLSEFNAELPQELRQIAGRGGQSSVSHALVTVAVPVNFDATRSYPVMVISATSDPQYHSSRRLLSAYAELAVASGWILIAADPAEEVSVEQDDINLRYALNVTALAALESQWPEAGVAPLAFGGFSGGAKFSGWLAAAFASRGRSIIGIYLAGINSDTVISAARHFSVLNESFRRTPVFLESGQEDKVATPVDHRSIHDQLKRAGFREVRIEYGAGSHEVDPTSLRTALDWFRKVAAPGQN
jgi:Predicted esterase